MKKKLFSIILMFSPLSAAMAQTTAADLSGQWMLIASNSGVEVAPGIFSAGTDTIHFTATPTADGTALECTTDSLYWRSGTAYGAQWRINVETNGEGQYRLGWILDADKPAGTSEFLEPQKSYMESGFFYWGGSSDGHRYIYLLSENADASAIVGMTFYSPWTSVVGEPYSLSNEENNSRKVYMVVAEAIPYGQSVGWVENWGSPRMERISGSTAGIRDVANGRRLADGAVYDLQGRRLNGIPRRGLYITGGRKLLR